MPRALLLTLACLLVSGAAMAQRRPLKGVVWQEPQDLQQAVAELYAMRRAGVEAVRTGIIDDERLFGTADALGLQLFQELPIEYLAAKDLQDSTRGAARMLDAALVRSRGHRSARHFGLARMSDTSLPEACTYFQQLSGRVRRIIPGARAYYVTPFVERDVCAQAVDFVLLRTLDADDPARVLARWNAHSGEAAKPVGLAAVGTWVRDDGPRGLRVPHSPEHQARYLEEHLNLLLSASDSLRPYAVFVYRWRDARGASANVLREDATQTRAYGVRSASGARPAFDVMSGIYTGRQTVFAFEAGKAPERHGTPWRTLFGWGSVALLGLLYATSPRLRFMVPRYFTARGFYRDAVREGRDVLLGSSVSLLTVLALTTGLVWSAFASQLARTDHYLPVLARLPGLLRSFLDGLEGSTWAGVLLVALLYVVSLGVWSVFLSLASRRRYVLSPTQTLMLSVWPRWPILLLLPAAVVAPTFSNEVGFQIVAGVVAVWLAITLFSVVRTVYDLSEVSRVPAYIVLAAFLLNPVVLVILALGVLVVTDLSGAAFLYRLLTTG